MSYLPVQFSTFVLAAGLLIGCDASQGHTSPSKAEVKQRLRSGPALTEAALAGMYMSRTSDDPEGVKFVACLDKFVLRFDEDAEVSTIFSEMAAETDTAVESGNVAYFTDQSAPGRYKRLVDQMIAIDAKTEGDIFNFDSSSTCVLSPADCSLPIEDASKVRLYWTTIEHGSMSCYE